MKRFRTILTVFCAAVLAINIVAIKADAVEENVAFIAFADESWGVQYWGSDDAGTTPGAVGTEVKVTGVGTYTIGLDFTGTEAGAATGLAFTAPMIQGGEATFPGYIIQIDEMLVNGEPIEFTKNYTSCDNDGKNQLRSNVYNVWATSLPSDARTVDGSLDGASAVIVDPADFASVETYEITFTLLDADGNGPAEEAAADVPKTGVVSLGLVYGLGALVTGAFVFKKRSK